MQQEGSNTWLKKEISYELKRFDQILMMEKDGKYNFGQPLIKDSFVEGKILRHGKAKKIVVLKYKPKKRYEKKTGHRQLFTEVKIEKIEN